MSAGSWRVAGRLARREVRRHPWRHLLVVGLIAVPVLAVFATFSFIGTWSEIEAAKREYWLAGREAAYPVEGDVLRGTVVPDAVAGGDPARLPDGAVLEVSHRGADWLLTDRDRLGVDGPELVGAEVIDAPLGSQRSARIVVDAGRLPQGDGEVLLTRSLAEAGPWTVGDTVTSARTGRRLEVVGVGVLGDDTDAAAAVLGEVPETYWSEHAGATAAVRTAAGDQVGLAPSAEVGVWLERPVPPDVLLAAGADPMAPPETVDERVRPGIVLAATAVCAVAATVASAAFALASRRQLRSIGLLSSVGTDPSTIRRLLVLQGALPGAAAGIVAVVVGAALAAAADRAGIAASVSHVAGAQIAISWGGAALAVVLAVASGVAAAWLPARTASRVPVLSALGGRRPIGPLPRRIPVAGLVLWAGGAVLLVLGVRAGRSDLDAWAAPFSIIAGVAAFAFGAIAMAPLLVVALGGIAGHVGGMVRLALRGITRQRAQSAAAVAAVGVALALPVGFRTAQTADARDEPEVVVLDDAPGPTADLRPPASAVAGDVTVVRLSGDLGGEGIGTLTTSMLEVLGPEAVVIDTVLLADDAGDYWMVTAVPGEAAGDVLEPWAAEALADGALVRTNAEAPGTGPVVLRYGEQALSLPVATSPHPLVDAPGFPGGYLVAADALGGFGADRPISGRAVLRPGPATDAELDALRALDPSSSYFGDGVAPPLATIRSAPDRFDPSQVDTTTWVEIVAGGDGDAQATAPPAAVPYHDGRSDDLRRILLWLTVASALVACTVLAVTLSLRAYDGRDDARAALAAGASPARIRSVRAIEGVVLALAGGALALPLGWGAVNALLIGQTRRSPEEPGLIGAAMDQLASPGWIVVPIVLVPAIVAALGWTLVPAVRARIAERHGPPDVLAPRW